MSSVRESQHDPSTQIVIIVDETRTHSPDHLGIFSGWQWEFLRGKLLRAGFKPEQIEFSRLADLPPLREEVNLIVGMGEKVLRHYTDKKGIDKWQLSPLMSHDGRKFIPTFDMGRVQKEWELGLYQELAFRRARKEAFSRSYQRTEERFLLNPSLTETLAILDYIMEQPEIAVDVETGYGQINTVGFAWSPYDAIAINVLPGRLNDESFFLLWDRIRAVLEGPSLKIFQNFIYDVSYFSAYGIRVANVGFDTMWAMKVLYPELKSNLGNVGRIYTDRPYWKDDGKVTDEEGAKKDWGNVRDWNKHYLYNCRDTTGTWEAKQRQSEDLRHRDLDSVFNSYILKLIPAILEMCSNGMPVSDGIRQDLKRKTQEEVSRLMRELEAQVGFKLNPNSPKQMLDFLHGLKVKLPKKYNKETGSYQESTDASSLKKVRLKHPQIKALGTVAEIKTLKTALSRYIDFDIRPDGRLSYSLNGCGTETLRWSGNKDPWDRGFNIQTIPREGGDVSIKQMFVAPELHSFMEVDLRQAESRFVAYDAADATLIEMLESGADVHRYVAAEIFHKSQVDVTRDERQLGKKAGHGANYSMKEGVFIETCFADMDLVLSRDQAKNTLEAYHRLFPGIRKWHASIREELGLKRKLSAPSGWERYFYGRFGDDMFKEAYAWRPQHTIPWITNHLMLHLMSERAAGQVKFNLLVQVHDSLILLVPDESLRDVAQVCLDFKSWHPRVVLPGGEMWIPTEVKYGSKMSELKEWGS